MYCAQIVFLTHGFKGSIDNTWLQVLQSRLVGSSATIRVHRCGWRQGAKLEGLRIYTQGPANIFANGFNLAEKMQLARDESPNAALTCMGHSLGAHSCGMAGKILFAGVTLTASTGVKKKLDKIIALDPAGPTFDRQLKKTTLKVNWRLMKTDAVFVYGLHTAAQGNLFNPGSMTPVGHLDVYPNQGKDQPSECYCLIGFSFCLRTSNSCVAVCASASAIKKIACNHAAASTCVVGAVNALAPVQSAVLPPAQSGT